MPRYCLFGDTVNTASRMESHGLPGKIHLSSNAFKWLEGHKLRYVDRGEIMVKGKGVMSTYFLEENQEATMDDILGKGSSKTSTPEKTDRCKSPPHTPTKEMPNGVTNYTHRSTVVIPMWYPDNDNTSGGTIAISPPIFPSAASHASGTDSTPPLSASAPH